MTRTLVTAVAAACAVLALPAVAAGAPNAVVTATPERGPAPLHVSLDGSGSTVDPGRTIASWDWDFDDGATAPGATPAVTHDYGSPGRYTARLTVTDDLGATSTATVEVLAQSLTLALTPRTLLFGRTTTAAGTLEPAEGGVTVRIERSSGGSWHTAATATTDAAGHYTASFTPSGGGPVRARVVSTGTTSGQIRLAVLPRLVLHRSFGRAFIGARFRVDVRPLTYRGRVVVTTRRDGRVVGRVAARVRDGVLRVTVPTPGIGRFGVRLRFPAQGAISARTLFTIARAGARMLSVGSRGADVRALLRRLAALHYRVPGISRVFSWPVRDSVIAFQKTVGLSRTGVVGTATWQALGRAHVPRSRFAGPALHIEIDKTRQVVFVVRDGVVATVLPTSTGATGNTPEGTWRIYLKTPGYNGLGMYYSMYFKGGFALHGYASVPTFPASHGCARLPIWTARSLYEHSVVGERVYVYH